MFNPNCTVSRIPEGIRKYFPNSIVQIDYSCCDIMRIVAGCIYVYTIMYIYIYIELIGKNDIYTWQKQRNPISWDITSTTMELQSAMVKTW